MKERQKTGTLSRVPLFPDAFKILQKYNFSLCGKNNLNLVVAHLEPLCISVKKKENAEFAEFYAEDRREKIQTSPIPKI